MATVLAVRIPSLSASQLFAAVRRHLEKLKNPNFYIQVDLMCGEGMNILPHVSAGKVKAYAVLSKARWFAAPEIPTAEEAGFPGLTLSFWSGLWVPKGTPQVAVGRLGTAVREALADPNVRQRLTNTGNEIPTLQQQTPQALSTHHKAEIDKWWPIIKAANIKPE